MDYVFEKKNTRRLNIHRSFMLKNKKKQRKLIKIINSFSEK